MLLDVDHLTKNYGRFRALDDLCLTIAPGEIVGLLGPNGAGKSTALRLLLGFLRPSGGYARIAGHDCWRDSVQARRQVAYLPGELRLYENMTGRQLVRFLSQLRQQAVRDDVAAMARQLDIDLDRPIKHLSSGMKRKVALLQVLLPRVPLLLMDEPTSTLDPIMRDELLHQLEHARQQGQAVLFSSHILTEVERVCDRVAILRKGRLVHVQQMAELRQAQRIRVRFSSMAPELPSFDGVTIHDRQGDRLILEHRGQMQTLLDWLAKQEIAELQIEPLGLAEIYHTFHGNAA